MEKRTPSYSLSVVKQLIEKGNVQITQAAVRGASALGFDFEDIIAIIMAMTSKDFYKSMTAYDDHRVWQDVYRPMTKAGKAYVKLIVVSDVLIISFKEL